MFNKKNTVKITLKEWIDNISSSYAQETIKILFSLMKTEDLYIKNAILSSFIGQLVKSSLNNTFYELTPDLIETNSNADNAIKHFNNLKHSIEEDVAKAFTQALSEYSGISTEYYCQIRLVPEPKSTSIN